MANILFLCQRIPYPPNKGEKIRAYHILHHLARRHRLFLGCFVDDSADWAGTGPLQTLCADSHFAPLTPLWATLRSARALPTGAPLSRAYYHSRALARWVRAIEAAHRPEAVVIYSSVMGQYVGAGPARLVVDFVDVDSDKWRQYAETKSWPMRHVYRREARTLLAFDRALAARADAAVFVSDAEADLFRTLAPESAGKVHTVANGVDSAYFAPGQVAPVAEAGRPVFVFTGTMDYWPNVDAVQWFAREILPLIRRDRPEARFLVVGARPSPSVQAMSRSCPGVHVTGAVADVRPYLERADAVVAPMRLARGLQNKVLEGMAMAKAVITTAQGVEGIAATNGTHLLVAGDAPSFAAACQRALAPETGERLGAAARELIVERYDWPAQLAAFEALLGV